MYNKLNKNILYHFLFLGSLKILTIIPQQKSVDFMPKRPSPPHPTQNHTIISQKKSKLPKNT